MHVVSHTHWDREWYLPFQRFRVRLVDLMDHLIDLLERDPTFRHFNLDGQTAMIEDYLEIRPEKRAALQRLARAGRVSVGPWYVLNDEFLASGESTVRSLLIGHRIAREFCPVMKVGYLPDQFGNISQAPQILLGFGIDNAIFGRGMHLDKDRGMEFWWESPDGSRVLASLMGFWYNNAQRFPIETDEALGFVEELRDRMTPVSRLDCLLLMNGVDHIEAQSEVPAVIARVNERLRGDRLVHSTLSAYVDAAKESIRSTGRELAIYTGELREDRSGSLLSGTLSSRMPIKQANERCQTALESYAEPAASFAWLLGEEYPHGLLTYAWKMLLRNHAHDSICGCSVDQVHREMMPRFDQCLQVAEEVTGRALAAIARRVKTVTDSLLVFNFLSWERTDPVRATVDLPAGPVTRGEPTLDPTMRVESIRLFDRDGSEVPIRILSAGLTEKQVLDPHELPRVLLVNRFVIEFIARQLPACGYRVYKIAKSDVPPASRRSSRESARSLTVGDRAIANEFLQLSLRGGRVRVQPAAGPEGWSGEINILEDRGDVGDEYRFIAPADDTVVTGRPARARVAVIDNSPVSATLKIETDLELPFECALEPSARSKETVRCPVATSLTVWAGVPRIDIETAFENRAKDHRLRVLFPTGIESDLSWAEGQFDVIGRPVRLPDDRDDSSPTHPQQRWVDVHDGERGLCIINKGLPEYELCADAARTVALTLLRCVGALSRDYTAAGAGPTPEAQCLGAHLFEYAVYPHAGGWEEARVWRQAHQHAVPLVAVQTGAHQGELGDPHSFLETGSAETIVSAIKKAEEGDMLVVRLSNMTAKGIADARLRVSGAESAKCLTLNEEAIDDVVCSDSTAHVPVGAKKIVTIGLALAPVRPPIP
jgi:alpha-mannosidase